MPGRDALADLLGKVIAEPVITHGRKVTSSVIEHEGGWAIVAARVGQPARLHFGATIRRCLHGQCRNRKCLGHGDAVARLTTTIRSTYK